MRKLDVLVGKFEFGDDNTVSLEFPGEEPANLSRMWLAHSMREQHPNSDIFLLWWDDEWHVPTGAKVGNHEVDCMHMEILYDKAGTPFGAVRRINEHNDKYPFHEMIVAVLTH